MVQRAEMKLFLTVFLIYGFYVAMSGPLNNVDALCVAMVERGTFGIDPGVKHDYAVVNGVKYSGYSPGASWLLAPLYVLLKPLCGVAPQGFEFQAFSMLAAWLLTIPLGALCVVALYRLLRDWHVEERAARLTALAFAFGTMWFAYARRHNSYSLISAALIFLAFFLIARVGPLRRSDALASGFLAMLAVTADYKHALSVFWVGLYLLVRHRDWKSWVWFAAGALPPLIAMLAYNGQVFGHPLYTPAKFEVARAGDEPLQPGVIPLEGALHFRWDHFWKLLVGPHTGFFLYVPVAILAWAGLWWTLREQRPDWRWALLPAAGIFLANLLLAASLSVFWHGGGTGNYYGPATRYLLPAVPFVMLFVGLAVTKVQPAVVGCFVALSVLVTGMFVLSASYGWGQSPIQPGWENLPFVVHARHIVATCGAESVWFNLLASSHFSLGKAGAAAVTWFAVVLVAGAVWWIWREPKRSSPFPHRPNNV